MACLQRQNMCMNAFTLCTLTRVSGSTCAMESNRLHLVGVEVGRILLRREGYTGSLEELRRVAGKFDEKVRASCRSSGTTRDESLPLPLHMPMECSKLPERQAGSAVVDSHMPIQWKHIPDDAQDILMRNQCRVLMALSLAAEIHLCLGLLILRLLRMPRARACKRCGRSRQGH